MQPLLDGPRSSLSESAVRGLLQSHSTIQITYGAEGLDNSFGLVGDLAGYISGGSITSSSDAQTPRSCNLTIDSDVTDTGWSYLSGFIRPYMTITDVATGVAAQFRLGVYTLTTPDRVLGSTPGTLSVTGYDLTYLLRQEVGDSYQVPTGSDPAQAAADAIGLAIPGVEIDVVPSSSLTPSQMTWPFDAAQPTLWIDIVNALLASIGYRAAWVDWNGTFHVEPWVDLQLEEPEWTFDALATDNIMQDDRKQNVDLYSVPNWFRFVMANLADLPVEGQSQYTWIDNSATNPGSVLNRGFFIKHIESVTVTSWQDLLTYAQRTIASMLKPSETFTVTTQPFPLAWHYDVIRFKDSNLDAALPLNPGGSRMVVATGWTLDITGANDMEWTWQTITDQDAGLGLAPTA